FNLIRARRCHPHPTSYGARCLYFGPLYVRCRFAFEESCADDAVDFYVPFQPANFTYYSAAVLY
ncbi:MAG: hypothetical protein WCC92_16830, partial [Candidatus Korobacteraceae bacterium]